jgi:hemerythrin-like domain-containing protein
MSEAIDVLRHEHEAILLALGILDRIAADAALGQAAPGDVAQFLGFLHEFADTCHHGKEERLLFPAMIDAGLPAQGGPISVMLAEHEQGRSLVAAMAHASEGSVDAIAFPAAAHAYADHLRAHIDKENGILFPMAENVVEPETLAALHTAFERHEEEVMGHGRHEQLHAMLKDLKARYGV